MDGRTLYIGDNLHILREMPGETVDLVYMEIMRLLALYGRGETSRVI